MDDMAIHHRHDDAHQDKPFFRHVRIELHLREQHPDGHQQKGKDHQPDEEFAGRAGFFSRFRVSLFAHMGCHRAQAHAANIEHHHLDAQHQVRDAEGCSYAREHGDDIGNHAQEEHPFGGASRIGFGDFPGVGDRFRFGERGSFPVGCGRVLHRSRSFLAASPGCFHPQGGNVYFLGLFYAALPNRAASSGKISASLVEWHLVTLVFDMGGPVNKAAYAFSIGLLSSQIYTPMAAVMAAGMTPPLGLALATLLSKDRFTHDEREAGKAAWVLGLSFITEGAIPFAAEDPFRVIPSIMIGSAVTGALSMLFQCQLRVPHGGVFVLPIPNVVTNLPMYALTIAIGTVVTAGALYVLKRPIAAEEETEADAPVAVAA
jgi:hypothetical protein